MSLVGITLIFLVAFICLIFKKYRLVFWLMLTNIGILFGIGSGLLPRLMSQTLQIHKVLNKVVWTENNAIIILGAGVSARLTSANEPLLDVPFFGKSRMLEGARLYHQCHLTGSICKVIVSGGDPAHRGISEAEVMSRVLGESGVSLEDIILEPKSLNTFQNAMETTGLLKGFDFKLKVLVTSGFHMKRAQKYFEFFEVAALPAPSDEFGVSQSWWPTSINFTYFDLMAHELIGIIKMDFFNLMGWNSTAGGPGSP